MIVKLLITSVGSNVSTTSGTSCDSESWDGVLRYCETCATSRLHLDYVLRAWPQPHHDKAVSVVYIIPHWNIVRLL